MAKETKKKAYVAIGIARNLKNSKYTHATRYKECKYHEIELKKEDSTDEVFAAIRKAIKEHGDDCIIGFGKTTHKAEELIARADTHDAIKKKRENARRTRASNKPAGSDGGV